MTAPGRLILVTGPSGAGKDSVMDWARQRTQGLPAVFAHRYITRAPEAGGENHVHLSPAEFAAREAAGLFALSWGANGLKYGIGIEIDAWMERGLTVVANGSRGNLPRALERYPELVPVLITAPPEVLAERLAARGRESSQAVLARLKRGAALTPSGEGLVTIVNDGPLEQAGRALLELIQNRA